MHTTGLPTCVRAPHREWDDYAKTHPSHFGYGNDYMLYGREDEQVKVFLYADTLKCTPGTMFRISRTRRSSSCQELIERLSGRRFENWMNDEIFTRRPALPKQLLRPRKPVAHAWPTGYIPFEGHAPKGTFVSARAKWRNTTTAKLHFFLSRADNGIFPSARIPQMAPGLLQRQK